MIFRVIVVVFTAVLVTALASVATPADSVSLKFSHKSHVQDQGISCLDCHTNAPQNKGKGASNHPSMKTCETCHEDAVTEKNCTMCHMSEKGGKSARKLHHKEFSHASHLERGVACAVCHSKIGDATVASTSDRPPMDVCMSCHNGKKASGDCHLCHTGSFEKIKPESHKTPWFLRKEHGRAARLQQSECASCHRSSSDCSACHRGQLSTRIHEPGFRFTHGTHARKGDKDCTLCHEVKTECITCHTKR